MKIEILRVLGVSIGASIMFYFAYRDCIRSNLDAIIHLSASVCFLCLPTLIFIKKNVKEMI